MLRKLGFLGLAALAVVLVPLLSGSATAQVDPPSVDITLAPGESFHVTKTVHVPELAPLVDVVISVDLTGSMWDELDNLKVEIDDIISDLAAAAGAGTDLEVGIISHEDYNGFFDSHPACDYAAQYGDGFKPDEPFRVDQPVTDDFGAAAAAVAAMTLGSGADGPESYARVMWESAQPDSGIGFRAGAQKILVAFLDDVPHDCNLDEGGPPSPWGPVTGIDPGRNAVIDLDGDDIDFQDDAVAAMQASGATLLVVDSSGWSEPVDWWDFWAAETGGAAVGINPDGTVPGGLDLSDVILGLVGEITVDVTPVPVGCDPLMVTFDPPVHMDIPGGTQVQFEECIEAPPGPGVTEVHCEVQFLADGAVIGVQEIHVRLVIEVDVDIKPWSYPNSINLKSKGVIPVAILSTEDFDATTVDPESVMFADASPVHYAVEDVDYDGDYDLILHFRTQDTSIAPGDMEACLIGETYDGVAIVGCDSVRTVPEM